MKILVLGSLNIDRMYQVDHFVIPGETVSSLGYDSTCGGKGFNQAVALSRAGSKVYFAGIAGNDGDILIDALKQESISTEYIKRSPSPNGHAIIQVDQNGQNAIIVVPGANAEMNPEYIVETLAHFGEGDLVLMQNELPHMDLAMSLARERKMLVAFNPSPITESIQKCDFLCIDILFINEIEGAAITGKETPEDILSWFRLKFPSLSVVLTLGDKGSLYLDFDGKKQECGSLKVEAVDTTAAGDTFTGYFLSALMDEKKSQIALKKAAIASGLAVTKKGAYTSIPDCEIVDEGMQQGLVTEPV